MANDKPKSTEKSLNKNLEPFLGRETYEHD